MIDAKSTVSVNTLACHGEGNTEATRLVRETNTWSRIIIDSTIEMKIVNDYKDGVSAKELQMKYGVKNIYRILNKYHIPRKNKKWTQEEINTLKELYSSSSWEYLLTNIPRFPKEEIIRMASRLKIKRDNHTYSQEELDIFLNYYGTMSVREFTNKFFPLRSEVAIYTKANKLGLVSREHWTENENEILIKHYRNTPNKYIQHKYLQNRTLISIICQSAKLGLKKESYVQFTKIDLIEDLKILTKRLGHTPTCDEINIEEGFPSLNTYHRYFGSYGNACTEAGLQINPNNIFGYTGHYEASDGTPCFSAAELKITEFLISNNICFEKEVNYSEIIDDKRCGKKRCDWLLADGTIVEYFGMPEKEAYRIKMNEKIEICKDNGVLLIELYRNDLSKLENIFSSHKMKVRND